MFFTCHMPLESDPTFIIGKINLLTVTVEVNDIPLKITLFLYTEAFWRICQLQDYQTGEYNSLDKNKYPKFKKLFCFHKPHTFVKP